MNKAKTANPQTGRLAGHIKLERRRLLNADFSFVAGDLELSNFTNDTAGADLVTFSQSGTTYSFVLSDGIWNDLGSDVAGIGAGTDTLMIDSGVNPLNSILARSTADEFDVDFGDFDFAGDIEFRQEAAGDNFGDFGQLAATSFVQVGTLTIDGAGDVDFSNAGNDLDTLDIDSINSLQVADVTGLNATALDTATGTTITAAGDVDLDDVADAEILDVTTTAGNITIDGLGSLTLQGISNTAVAPDGNLTVTTVNDITDTGVIDVAGNAQFTSTAGAIDLDQLAVDGTIGVSSDGDATIVNATAIDLAASTVGGNLSATATTGDVTDSGTVDVTGTAQFTSTAGAIDLDLLAVDGSIGLSAATNATIVNATAVDLAASTVGGDLDVTATTGDITDSGVVDVTGMAHFNSPTGAITLDQLSVDGSIGLLSAGNATVVNVTAVDLKASTVGGDLDVTATTGDVTDSGTVDVTGTAQFTSTAGAIDLDLLAVDGSIGLSAATNATIVNATAVDLAASTVGGDLDVTATTGDVTDSGTVDVTGMAQFTSTAGALDLDQLAVDGSIGLNTATNATIVNATAVDLAASTVGGDLDVTATTGDITDSGTVDVTGMAQFNSPAGAILLDQLAIDGSIGLLSAGNATIVNATAVDLKASTVGGDLDVTATTGDITDSGTVDVTGMAQFTSTAGAIDLDLLAVDGSIGLSAATNATIVNATAVDLAASTVGGDLNVTATTGDITDSGTVDVTGMAQFNSPAGAILLDQLAIDGSIGLLSAGNATIVNATAVDLKASTVGGDLDVTATTGDITDSGTVDVTGMAQFTSTAGAIDLDLLAVDGSIGLSAATNATIVNATAVDLAASTVGGDLNVTATTGDITDSGTVDVTGMAQFNSPAGAILLDQLAVDGSIGLLSDGNATIVNATAVDLKASTVGGNLSVTATTGNITQSGPIVVTGDADFVSSAVVWLTTTTNDFGGTVAASGTTVEIADANDLTVGTITAVDDIFLRAGAGAAGALTINGNLTTTNVATGQTLLQASNGATQDAGSVISTRELVVGGDVAAEGTGNFNLTGSNTVDIVAANIIGQFRLTNALPLTVGSIAFVSACGTAEAAAGVVATEKARIEADGITINNVIQADTVALFSSGGVTQAVAGIITSDELILSGMGNFVLTNVANNTARLAADITGDLSYTDADTVTIAELTCDTDIVCGLDIDGNLNLTTNNGDIFQALDPMMPAVDTAAVIVTGNTVLNTGTGDICLTGGDCTGDGLNDNRFDGTLTVISTGDVVIAENDDITIDSVGAGGGSYRFIGNNIQINTAITGMQLLLEAKHGVDYNNNVIDVTDLLLSGTGRFDFGFAGDTANSIDNLAADIDGALNLLNATPVNIGDLTFTSDCGDVRICGVNIDVGGGEAGDFELRTTGASVSQTAAIQVEGLTTLDVGVGDICFTGGDCTGDGVNDNDFNEITIVAATNAEIVDINDLTVTSATVTNQLWLAAGDQGSGQLTLAGNVTVNGLPSSQVLLQASNGVTQTSGVISTPELMLGGDEAKESSGLFDLQNGNVVGNLATNLQGDLIFHSVSNLTIVAATYDSVCDDPLTNPDTEVFTGLISTVDAILVADMDLTQTALVDVNGLGLQVGGNTLLNNTANAVKILAADNVGATQFTNSVDLMVDSVSVDTTTITGITTVGADVLLTVEGNLSIDEAITVTVADLGLNVTGDVTQASPGVILANGLALNVDGDTILDANNTVNIIAANAPADATTGSIRFTNTGDLKVNAVTIEAVAATRSDLVIDIAAAQLTSAITTAGNDVKLTAGGNLTLELTVTLGAGDLFLDVAGDVTQLATGTITAAGLGLQVDGETILDNLLNNVDVIAANNGAATRYTDADDLKVGTVTIEAVTADRAMMGTVTAAAMTTTGITTTDDDVKLTVPGNLTFEQAVSLGAGDLFLDVTGDVTQLAAGTIDAAGLGLNVDGETILDNPLNDVDVIAADNGSAIRYTDANDLKVGTVTAEAVTADRAMVLMNGSIVAPAMSVTGITTSNDDVKLTAGGNLTLEAAVSLGTGDFFLDVTGDVTQLAAGTINATGLGLNVDGETILDNLLNDVDVIAANNGSATRYTDANDLKVGSVTVEAVTADQAMAAMNGSIVAPAMSVTGITTTDDDVKLTVAGNLTVEQAVALGSGDFFLDVAGDVTQLAAGTIDASGLGLVVDGETILDNPLNDVDVIAASNGSAIRYTDANDLKVGIVTAEAVTADRAMTAMNGSIIAPAMTFTGITTTNDDVKLTTGGNVTVEQAVAVGAGDFFLDVAGDVTQLAAGTITAAGLGLNVDGETILDNPLNDVDVIAADNGSSTRYTDANDLKVGTVTAEAVAADRAMFAMNGSIIAPAMSVAGITTTDDDVKLTAGGNLTIEVAVTLGSGDLFLDVAGDVTQLAAGTINAAGLGLMVVGETILDNPLNDVDVIAANNDSAIRYTDANDLKVGSVTAEAVTADRAMFAMNGAIVAPAMTVTGITTTSDDVKLTVGGNLTVEQAVTLGSGDFFLDVAGDVTQLAAGRIDAAGLGLMVDGDTILDNPLNDVDVIAASNGSAIRYTDANDLKVGNVTAEAVTADRAMVLMNGSIVAPAMSVTGITTTNDDVKLTAGGNVTLEAAVSLGTADFFLDVDGDVTQLAAGTINAVGLGLNVDGETILDNPLNDVDVIAANNGSATRYTDANDLKVGTVTVEAVTADRAMAAMNGSIVAPAMTVTGITTTDDDVKLTAGGNLTVEQAVALGTGDFFLDVAGDVTQLAAGSIDAGGLGLVVDGENILDNPLNDVDVIAANNSSAVRYTDANDLKVGIVTAEAVSADRAMTAMNGSIVAPAMTVTGITTTNNDVKLTAGGNVTVEQAVAVGAGDFFLDVAGDVTQLAAGKINAAGLGLVVDGETILDNPLNDVDVIAADNGSATRYTDVNDLKVGTVTVEAVTADRAMAAMNGSIVGPAMTVTGITTTDDDVKLTVGGNLTVEQAVALGTGDFFLDVSGDMTQLAAGTIDAVGLGLNVDGETILDNPLNDVDVIAADNGSATRYTDANDLKVGVVTAEAVTADRAMAAMNGSIVAPAMTVTGITTTNDDVKLTAGGNLTVEQAVALGTGDFFLDVAGDVTQLAAGTINAVGLGLVVDGETILDNPLNDVDVIAASNGSATRYTDANDLRVGVVTAQAVTADRAMVLMNGSIVAPAMSVTGITTTNDDVKLTAAGNLTIERAVALGIGDFFLDVAGDVTQLATGAINATGLGLGVDGNTILDNPLNDVIVIAAANDSALRYTDANDLTVGTVTVQAVTADRAMFAMNGSIVAPAMTVNGITTTNDDVKLTVGGNLNIVRPVSLGDGDLFLVAGGNVSQSASGCIEANGLGLMVNGTTTLTNPANNVDRIAANNVGQTEYVDANTLIVANDQPLGASAMYGQITIEAVTATRANGSTATAAGMTLGDILVANDGLWLRTNGLLEIAGNITTPTVAGVGQVLLQSSAGTVQDSNFVNVDIVDTNPATASVITTSDLMVGGNLASEGSGLFSLTGQNVVSRVTGNLAEGTLQLNNTTNLTVAASLTFSRNLGVPGEFLSGISAFGAMDEALQLTDPTLKLVDTIQGANVNVADPGDLADLRRIRYNPNPNFTQYLDTTDIGIAVTNTGILATEFNASVVAGQSEIYLETFGNNDLNINFNVTVNNPANRILAIAGGRLNFGVAGEFERGVGGADGLVFTKLNDLLLLNPGIVSISNAQVDATALNQRLQFVFGDFGEQRFDSTIFFGIAGPENDRFDLVQLLPEDVIALQELLFSADGITPQFESRSVYNPDPLGTFDGIADGLGDTVISQPIASVNDISGNTLAGLPATASFTRDFLISNPVFRNVQFLFNDANINLFENGSNQDLDGDMSGDGIVDLNVATADFTGLARVGVPPVIAVERTEFQLPETVEISQPVTTEIIETIVTSEDPLFVQTVQDKFFFVIYFDSQAQADSFDDLLDLEVREDSDTDEIDLQQLIELFKKAGVNPLTWESEDTADANQIREILESAGLDLEDDEDEWLTAYKKWLKEQGGTEDAPAVPRGVYKIIDVDNGKAVIRGDDVDRRFVPEPGDDSTEDTFQFSPDVVPVPVDDVNPDDGPDLQPPADNDSAGTSNSADPSTSVATRHTTAGVTTLGLMAMIAKRQRQSSQTIGNELETLADDKSPSPHRNVFSRASRFRRRHEFTLNQKN